MRAIAVESFEAGPVLVELAVPEPGPGEVLVRVRTSSVNGYDVAVATGMLQGMLEHRFPVVLGKDFAGTVEATGAGVSSVAAGDEVFGVLMRDFVGDGTFAEYVVIPAGIGLTKNEADLDPRVAGALGLAGAAAHAAIEAVAPSSGETVLISGATGGVGAIAIQLARGRGAEIIATARAGEESEFVEELGATHTVDYTGDISAQVRSICPEGVHAAVHLAGDGLQLAGLVARNGRFASTLGLGPDQLGGELQATSVAAMPTAATLDSLADAAAGRLRVPIQRTYRLEDGPQALSDFAAGTLGKLAITIDG